VATFVGYLWEMAVNAGEEMKLWALFIWTVDGDA
jgi:hypothetical protein